MLKTLITTLALGTSILGTTAIASAHPVETRETITRVTREAPLRARTQPVSIRERGHGPVIVNRTPVVRGEVRGPIVRGARDRFQQVRLERDRYYVGGRFTRPWITLAAPAPIYEAGLAVHIAPEYSTVSTLELTPAGGSTFVQSVGIQYADGHVQNVSLGFDLTAPYDLPLDGSGIAPTNVTVYGQSGYGATVAVTAL